MSLGGLINFREGGNLNRFAGADLGVVDEQSILVVVRHERCLLSALDQVERNLASSFDTALSLHPEPCAPPPFLEISTSPAI